MDYISHPVDLNVEGSNNSSDDIQKLRKAIPAHCFRSSYSKALYYLARDISAAVVTAWAAYRYIPGIESFALRWSAWALYGWIEGLFFTGLWVIGHDCGHSAFLPSKFLSDCLGFFLHSALLTPYFSWKFTHRRHHIYANHLTKDLHYVPPLREEYADSMQSKFGRLEELAEDAPFFILFRIILQQLAGWPCYILTNITAPSSSLQKPSSGAFLGNSHFAPNGSLFLPQEFYAVCASDIGVLMAILVLSYLAQSFGTSQILLLYLQPYLWVNHWIVAITYLHHTHPKLPKFEPEAWSFVKGATATVDRDFGLIGRHIFHGIIEFHVVHHLFPRISFYHAEAATNAIIPLLGDNYHSDKHRPYLSGLWEAFQKCQWVAPDKPDAKPSERAMWYKSGPSPPPEYTMGRKLWRKMN